MLPTVEQLHVEREPFPHRRVDALPQQQHSPVLGVTALRVQVAAAVLSVRSMSFLPLRARKVVVDAGSVRDGP